MQVYTIRKHMKNLDYSVGMYVATLKNAYRSKEKAIARRDELNAKSYNYRYTIGVLEVE